MARLWFLTSFAAGCLAATFAAAQPQEDAVRRPRMDTNAAPAQSGQPAPGGVVQQKTRPFYLQGAVVALLSGGAVWIVCRNSRRQ